MNIKVTVCVKVIGTDGIAELSTTMKLERVPVKGDFLDLNLSTAEDECPWYREVQRVELSPNYSPYVYIKDEKFGEKRNWDGHEFDGGGIGEPISFYIDCLFPGWDVDERRTCWSDDFHKWLSAEFAAYHEISDLEYQHRKANSAKSIVERP